VPKRCRQESVIMLNRGKGFQSGFRVVLVIFLFWCIVPGRVMATETTLVIGLESDIERLLPYKIKTPTTFPVSMQIYQGLFDLDENGEIIPNLVERYETKDHQTWIFDVRKDVYFHPSDIFADKTREMTAQDVVYSLQRFCSQDSFASFLLTDSIKGAKAFSQGKASEMEGLKTIGKYRFQVELLRPEPFFLSRLSTAWVSVFPKEMDDKAYEKQSGFSIAVGTGPFRLVSQSENEITLEKNKDYWNQDRMPQVEKLVFKVIKNDQARYVSMVRGDINFMTVPSKLFPLVMERDGSLKPRLAKNFQKKEAATFNTHFIGINNKRVSDVNLRKAISFGTDRKEMADTILYGYGDVMPGPVPPGMTGYPRTFGSSMYDPEKAKTFLAKSQYTGEPLELIVHDLANSELIGQLFQAQMAMIGIKIKLTRLDFDGAVQKILGGDTQLFSMFMEYVYSSPEPILINNFSSNKIPVPNFMSYSNPQVDKMLDNLFQARPVPLKDVGAIEAKIMDDAPGVFLYRQRQVILYPEKFTGLEISPNNHIFFESVRVKE
jgi:ABC-type transport system substrate-binding protein